MIARTTSRKVGSAISYLRSAAAREGIEKRDLSQTAQTINERGTTIVLLEVKTLPDSDEYLGAIDPAYATPGPDENQNFENLKVFSPVRQFTKQYPDAGWIWRWRDRSGPDASAVKAGHFPWNFKESENSL